MKKISLLILVPILTLVSCGPTSISASEAMNITKDINDYILMTTENCTSQEKVDTSNNIFL